MSDDDLRRAGLDPAGVVDLEMEAGRCRPLASSSGAWLRPEPLDHRPPLLTSTAMSIADNCDRGVARLQGRRAATARRPVLIHYEDLHSRPTRTNVDA